MKPFKKLRAAMVLADISVAELAQKLKVDPSTCSMKLNGKRIVTIWEMYTIAKAVGIGNTEIAEYFPPELAVPNEGRERKAAI